MPLYRSLDKIAAGPAKVEPTRLVARPAPGAKARSRAVRAPERTQPASIEAFIKDPLGPVVGWLAVISGPGCGQVLGLHYGVNDIGRGAKARVRLDFGDPFIALDNQAAIIYTARSRRFYLQSIASETWLNERPTQDSVELAGGEVLQLGQTRLRFVPLCGTDFDWRDNA